MKQSQQSSRVDAEIDRILATPSSTPLFIEDERPPRMHVSDYLVIGFVALLIAAALAAL